MLSVIKSGLVSKILEDYSSKIALVPHGTFMAPGGSAKREEPILQPGKSIHKNKERDLLITAGSFLQFVSVLSFPYCYRQM